MKIESREFLPKRELSTHASTMCFHPKGHPVYAWFEGPREGHPSVFIRIYNLNGDGKSILIGDKDAIPRWNPILFEYNSRIYLFEKLGEFCDRWQTRFHDITDWTEDITSKEISANAQVIPAGLNGPVKTKPLFRGNMLYCGSSVETIMDWTSYIESYRIIGGKLEPVFRTRPLSVEKVTYQNPYTGYTGRSLGIIQPSLWMKNIKGTDNTGIPDIELNAFFRSSHGLGKIYHSSSVDWEWKDSFEAWFDPKQTTIDNPNSSVDVVSIGDRLFLACNPVKVGRLPLVVMELDEKFNCIETLPITTEMVGQTISQEASYPYLIEKDGRLHLSYTYGRSKIEHVEISV